MKTLRTPLIALALLGSLAAAQRAYYIPRIVERAESRVGPSGLTEWDTTREFVEGSRRAWFIFPGFFLLGAFGNAAAIRYGSVGFNRFPNKRYWMSTTERRRLAAAIVARYWLWFLVAGMVAGIVGTQAIAMELPSVAAVAGLGFIVVGFGLSAWLHVRMWSGNEPAGPA